MQAMADKGDRITLKALALAVFVVFALFAWQGNVGFNLWDEGFLWYGVQRTMLGELPIRDFMAYEPGRYYWSAGLMSLTGDDGIMALRVTVAIFQAIGLFVGLMLIARSAKPASRQSALYLLLCAVTLAVWMFPRHKLFDISLSILLVGALAFLVSKPTGRRYFVAGVCVGLAAVFGRNHGVYGVIGSFGVMIWLSLKRSEGARPVKGFALWAAGVVAGFSPVLLMALLMPGFAAAFWESIGYMFEVKATNLPLPVPWPWRVPFALIPLGDATRGVLVGSFFIGLVVLGAASVFWVTLKRVRSQYVPPALVAAAFLALPYAHFAYSRADVGHLAQGIFPLLIGCLALLAARSAKTKWPLAGALCAASLWVTYVSHPGWQCHASKQCVDIEVSNDRLQVDKTVAGDVGLLRSLAGRYVPEGQSFIATPLWPGAYPLLERKSPMWEIYALRPRSQDFQRLEIEHIAAANPHLIVVLDVPLDGREELRFRNTHPLIQKYIEDRYRRVPYAANPAYQIYVRPMKIP